MHITYTGWIRLGSFDDADDIIYLEGGEYTNSKAPKDEPVDRSDNIYFKDERVPLADVLQHDICGKQVTVCYWITDQACTKDEAQEQFLKRLYGAAECEFYAHYSDITGHLWTDEELTIGGHDLIDELNSYVDKFVILDIEVHHDNK